MARRGRFRTFDPEQAARGAMRVFWERGYEGATLAALKSAMGGICSPSLYAAFGSKEALFRRVLELYWQEELLPAMGRLQSTPAQQAIEDFFVDRVRRYTDPARPKGCLLAQGSLPLSAASSSRVVEEGVRRLRGEITRLFQIRLERARCDGELSCAMDPERLARLLSALLQGLSVQARDGAGCDELLGVVSNVGEWLAK